MKKGIVIISACFFLFSCVSKTKYSEALSTIDSLKCTSDKQYSEAINTINSLRAENTRLTKEVDDLLNGEERLITFYQELCSKKAYIQAEEMYNKIVSKYPESQSNKRLSNIAIIKKKAIIQRDSINKTIQDSIRLANINELGYWKIGDYINDFKEPTGKHFVYQDVYGSFSNSATAGSTLRVEIRLSRDDHEKNKVIATIKYDEYNDGTIDESIIEIGSKIVCNATRTVYKRKNYWYYDTKIGYDDNTKLTFADILRQEQSLEITDNHDDYVTTIYSFSINCQYLNNALIKAGILDFNEAFK